MSAAADSRMPASPYPVPSRLNLLISILQLVMLPAILWGAGRVSSGWAIAALALGYALLMNSAYAMLHEAEHNLLHHRPFINQGVGVLLGLFFPAPYHLLRQGHLGHHLRNRSDDEAFDVYLPGDNRLWKGIQFYGILTGFFWLFIVLGNFVALLSPKLLRRSVDAFDRTGQALSESLNPRYDGLIRLEAFSALALNAALCVWFAVPPLIYFLVLACFGVLWSAFQDIHHYKTVRDVHNGARNLRTFALLDIIWLNHNWHLNHHRQPTIPWIYLPALSPPEEKRGTMLPAYLRMWRGPQYSEEHVENRFAGQIIR